MSAARRHPHGVRQQIAEGGLARPGLAAARVERRRGLADHDVQGLVEVRPVAVDLRGERGVARDAGGRAEAEARCPDHTRHAVAALDPLDRKGEHAHMAALGTGLHHRLAAVMAGDEQMIVAAQHHVDRVHRAQKLEVRPELLVGQRDDDIDAGRFQRVGRSGAAAAGAAIAASATAATATSVRSLRRRRVRMARSRISRRQSVPMVTEHRAAVTARLPPIATQGRP